MAPDETGSRKTDVFIGVLYALAIGINVYLVADQLSNGELSRNLSMKAVTYRGRIGYWLRERQEYRKAAAHVVWQAMETVEGQEDS